MYKRQAFDKVARVIGMGYPGGPKIEKAAREGDKDAIKFPHVFLEDGSYDFSFSGLKSAVLNLSLIHILSAFPITAGSIRNGDFY